MRDSPKPTTEEQSRFSLRSFKGIEAGLGQADPVATIAQKLEEKHAGHLILVQSGNFLHGYDRLTLRATRVYSSVAGSHSQSSFEARVIGGRAASNAAIFTSVSLATLFGRRVRDGASHAGSYSRSSNPRIAALLHFEVREVGLTKPNRSLAMQTAPIDRETASTINPLISNIWTEDTLDQCARVIRDLGYFLSQMNNPPEGTEPHFGNLYLLTMPIAAALDYEAANPCLTSGNMKGEAA